jgi:hypothetical protein
MNRIRNTITTAIVTMVPLAVVIATAAPRVRI